MSIGSFLRIVGSALILAVAGFGCGDGSDDPTATPSSLVPTDSVSGTPASTDSPGSASPTATEDVEKQTFDKFAVQVEQALTDGSADLFLSDPILTDFQCPNELLGNCGDGPAATIIQAVVLARWRSEGYPASLEELESELNAYFAGGPRLVALAVKDAEGEEGTPAYYAIAAADGDPESTAVFTFRQVNGEFRLQTFMLAPVLGEDWTSGTCSECYDHWEPW